MTIKRPWYKFYPDQFLQGISMLNLEQKGAYTVILNLIYANGGPIPDDPKWIAHACGCSVKRWNRIKNELKMLGKCSTDGQRLANRRALDELRFNEINDLGGVEEETEAEEELSLKDNSSSADARRRASPASPERRATRRPRSEPKPKLTKEERAATAEIEAARARLDAHNRNAATKRAKTNGAETG